MLPETTVGFVPNLMWTASVNAYEDAKSELNASAGILVDGARKLGGSGVREVNGLVSLLSLARL